MTANPIVILNVLLQPINKFVKTDVTFSLLCELSQPMSKTEFSSMHHLKKSKLYLICKKNTSLRHHLTVKQNEGMDTLQC